MPSQFGFSTKEEDARRIAEEKARLAQTKAEEERKKLADERAREVIENRIRPLYDAMLRDYATAKQRDWKDYRVTFYPQSDGSVYLLAGKANNGAVAETAAREIGRKLSERSGVKVRARVTEGSGGSYTGSGQYISNSYEAVYVYENGVERRE